MKRLFLVTLVGFLQNYCVAQQILQKTFDDANPKCMIPSGDAGYLISGITSVNGKSAVIFLKIDSMGNQQWGKTFSDSVYSLYVHETIRLHDDGYLTSGSSINQTTGVGFYWLLKTDATGNFLQAKTYSSAIALFCPHIIENEDSTIICAGERNYAPQSGLPPKNFMLMKLDANLNVIWAKEYAFRFQNNFTDLALAPDGNYIFQGYAKDTTYLTGRSDCVVLKADTSGNLIWAKQCGNKQPSGIYLYGGNKLMIDSSGEIINGFSVYWYGPSTDIVLQKLDSMGNEILSHRIASFNPQGADLIQNFYFKNNEFFLLNVSTVLKMDISFNSIFIKRVITSWPNWNGYNQLDLFNNNTEGIDLLGGVTLSSGLSKILFTKADSSGEIGCGGSNQFLINQFDSLPSIDISNFISDSLITVVDSSIGLKEDTLLLVDSILCLTSTNLNAENKNSEYDYEVFPTLTLSFIKVNNNTVENIKMHLLDLTGRELMSHDYSPLEKKEFDITYLDSGVYLIVMGNKKRFRIFKFIKL